MSVINGKLYFISVNVVLKKVYSFNIMPSATSIREKLSSLKDFFLSIIPNVKI